MKEINRFIAWANSKNWNTEQVEQDCFFDPSVQMAWLSWLARSSNEDIAIRFLNKTPDSYGELIREASFIGEGYGCYSTFDVAKDLIEIKKTSKFGKSLLSLLINESRDFEGWNISERDENIKEIKDRAQLYMSPSHFVAWYWDGDGTLLVGEHQDKKVTKAAINTDCKKDYDWKFL